MFVNLLRLSLSLQIVLFTQIFLWCYAYIKKKP